MQVAEEFSVPAPPGEVWKLLVDVPAVIDCMPGARLLRERGDGAYDATLALRVGPLSAQFGGELALEKGEADRNGVIRASGSDPAGGSGASAEMTFRVVENAAGGSRVEIAATVSLSGALAQFERSDFMRIFTKKVISEFSSCLSRRLEAPPSEAPVQAAPEVQVGKLVAGTLWEQVLGFLRRLTTGIRASR